MAAPLEVRVAPKTWVPVENLYEASLAVRQYLEASWIGASKWGQLNAPVCRAGTRKVIALVSYNGRVWTTERDWQRRTEITGAALHEAQS